MEKQMNAIKNLLLSAGIALLGITACNYTVGECWPVGQEGGSSEGVTAGGGVILPTGPSGAGGFGDQPPKEPQNARDPKQEIKCNSDEDEDAETETETPTETETETPIGCNAEGTVSDGTTFNVCSGTCTAPCAGVNGYSASIFKFVTTVPDDGTGDGGGWQEAKVILKMNRWTGLLPESWSCPQLTFGAPLRNKKQGKISAEFRDLPQGIFCFKLKEQLSARVGEVISGATVKQP
jgi:hypothetical protein